MNITLPQVKANDTLMQLVAADWLKSDKREDNLGARPGIVQVPPRMQTNFFVLLFFDKYPIAKLSIKCYRSMQHKEAGSFSLLCIYRCRYNVYNLLL